MGLRVKVQTACIIVVACAVLHNIAIRCGEEQPPDDFGLGAIRMVYEEVPVAANHV